MIYELEHDVLQEGFKYVKEPPKNFFKDAEKILNGIDNKLSKLTYQIFSKEYQVKDNAGYKRSLEKCNKIISQNKPKFKLSLNTQAVPYKEIDPKGMVSLVVNNIKSAGFKIADRKGGVAGFIEELFDDKGDYFYKESGDNIFIVNFSVMSQESGLHDYTTFVQLWFKCVEKNDKVKNKLNLESSDIFRSYIESVELN